MIPVQMQLSQKQKNFSRFFVGFLKSSLNFKHFEKKDDPHRFCIFVVTDSENVVRQIFKKFCFRVCSDKQWGKRTQTLVKSASQHLCHFQWSLASKLCSKNSLLLSCQILVFLANTLATNEKYPVLYRANLRIPIHI